MPLTQEELESIQLECLADDVDIVFEKMSLWDKEDALAYFENGGELPPGATMDNPKGGSADPPAVPPAPPLPHVSDAEFKKWFPKWQKPAAGAKFRVICFHNAGSSESVWSGRGMRQTTDNPLVVHCRDKGGELLALELPGRESRRSEKRETQLHKYAEAIFPVLAPKLQEAPGVPYVLVAHSMGTWLAFEFLKLLQAKGIPMPAQLVVSGFPAPDIPLADRPWKPNKPMGDPAFMTECRGWNVNEVVFAPANWGTFSPIMRDDFTLFDAYEYAPAAAPFAADLRTFYASNDQRVKKAHVEGWKRFGAAAFSCDEIEGNHLFFYDVPQRAKYFTTLVSGLPPAFQ